tara:strand:- start:135 stop:1121 length:987 start_codon:yes stop_codon:yes gene_type:complete
MRTIKPLIYLVVALIFNNTAVFATVTAGTPTNLIQKIASSSSFTATNQDNFQNTTQIQNTTSAAIDGKQLRKTVEQDAKAFGLLVNEAALARESGIASTNKQMVQIGGPKNLYEGKKDLEPTLDTIVYDTGLVTLTKEGGHYNDDTSNTIFDATSGAQQGRIKVYVDFKRKVLWGDVESRITLTGETQMTNTYVGASGAITTLPVDKELIHTIDDGTNQALPVNSEPYPWLNKHATTSLVKADGSLAPYYDASERSDMQTNVSHGTGGDNNVLVEARFTTTGSGTPGQSTVSFEASHAAANASASDFADGVVRYSATVETTATKYTGN